MASKGADHTSLLYRRIIETTCAEAAQLQSEAVLRELRQQWLAKLAERIREIPKLQEREAKVEPAKAADLVKQESKIWENPVLQPVKNEVKEDEASQQQQAAATGAAADDKAGDQPADDDGWGDWEDADTAEENSKKKTVQPVVEVVEEEKPVELDPSIPTDADFASKLRTQYGGGTYGFGENPDVVDSDLDEVETLENDEPASHDYIVGHCVELLKPGGRSKTQMQGTWQIRARNGIAIIQNQEFMFDTLDATLDF